MNIKLADIRIDGGTQTRAEINGQVVSEYADAVLEGAKFPPIDVFFDGVSNWLADGFHRFHAHKRAKVKDIAATIHTGSVQDAVMFALGANIKNGLRRTNEDKRKCVEIALENFAGWSDRRVAEVCGVAHTFVGKIRSALVLNTNAPTHRETSDGRKYPSDRKPAAPDPQTKLEDASKEEPQQAHQPAPRVKIDAAERIWAVAKGELDKITKGDVSRERVLLQVIAYCQKRIETHK